VLSYQFRFEMYEKKSVKGSTMHYVSLTTDISEVEHHSILNTDNRQSEMSKIGDDLACGFIIAQN
jgi:hypothetical protein